MMTRKWVLLALLLAFLTLPACDPIPGFSDKDGTIIPTGDETLSDGSRAGGYAEGQTGDVMGTTWFNFCVNSAATADEYGGYRAANGTVLLVVSITLDNTFGSPVPMSLYDFELWQDDIYIYGIAQSEMSDNYVLEKRQSLTQDIVYEIPAPVTGEYLIAFTEYFETEQYGSTFIVTLHPEGTPNL